MVYYSNIKQTICTVDSMVIVVCFFCSVCILLYILQSFTAVYFVFFSQTVCVYVDDVS